MAQLLCLPNEILHQTLSSLRSDPIDHVSIYSTNRNLKCAALTCRRFRDIAQILLHKAPLIQSKRSILAKRDGGSRLAPVIRLLRTLLERPDLRVRIETLTIDFYIHLKGTNGRDEPERFRITEARDLVKQMAAAFETKEITDEHWSKALGEERDYPLFGLLLSILPNLKKLHIMELSNLDVIQKIFARTHGIDKYPDIPSLAGLQSLKLEGRQVLSRISELPSLRALDLNLFISDYGLSTLPATFTLTKLRVNCCFRALRVHSASDWQVYVNWAGMANLLARVRGLTTLQLYDESAEKFNYRRNQIVQLNFAALFAAVESDQSIFETLESLELPTSWIDLEGQSSAPFRTLQYFKRLRHLKTSSLALVPHRYGQSSPDEEGSTVTGSPQGSISTATSCLPSTIKQLEVHQSNQATLRWLDDVLRYKDVSFPNIQYLRLEPQSSIRPANLAENLQPDNALSSDDIFSFTQRCALSGIKCCEVSF
ncbi:hypothetical protein BDV95DRAFT_580308 [Massariosphaeria phaeospora]|uniref:F-box domain-containing protein n=1 Tax=Massariosphaeria phaeospora TaxID=100035 RepID=A0A7C8I197_9PLEO|nr:hypothetical protein BDV95DRAFT_580308 [Massariosphaeria phaeospora]